MPYRTCADEQQTVINNLLKMVEPELVAGGILRSLDIDPSFQILSIHEVLLDPSRLLQVLINLLTNAVKFTKFATQRAIAIYVRVSLERPKSTMHGYDYLPQRQQRTPLPSPRDPSAGRKIYLEFCVEDTGKGLSDSEKEVLFQRFSQAPKTHVHYGGSGLGLFISRELVELQGGQIGVASDGKEKGCKFSFYIEARRVNEPDHAQAQSNSSLLSLPQAQGNYAIRRALDHDGMDIDLTTPGVDTPSSPPFFGHTSSPHARHALIVEDNLVNVSFATHSNMPHANAFCSNESSRSSSRSSTTKSPSRITAKKPSTSCSRPHSRGATTHMRPRYPSSSSITRCLSWMD